MDMKIWARYRLKYSLAYLFPWFNALYTYPTMLPHSFIPLTSNLFQKKRAI